jgi:hypothetical protein
MGLNALILKSCFSHNIQSSQKRFSVQPLNMHADPVFATVCRFSTLKTEIECTLCAHGMYNPISAKAFQLRAH